MEPEQENADLKEDVDMINPPPTQQEPASELEEKRAQVVDSGVADDKLAPVAPMTTELPLRTGRSSTTYPEKAILTTATDVPPGHEQIKTLETMVLEFAQTVREGTEAYLVSQQWLQKARQQASGLDAKHAIKEGPPPSLGPVDNSDIIDTTFTDATGQQFTKLKPGMGMEHFELFPKNAWDLLLSWYGLAPGQPPIIRTAHNTAPDSVSAPNIQFEFHPPVFAIHRLWSAHSPIPVQQELKMKNPPHPVVVQSSSSPWHGFLKQVKDVVGVAPDRKVRVWEIIKTIPAADQSEPSSSAGIKTPPDSPGRSLEEAPSSSGSFSRWPHMLVEVDTFLALTKGQERLLVEAEDTTTNPNYNGRKSLQIVGLTVDRALVLDEEVDNKIFISTFTTKDALKNKSLNTSGSSNSLSLTRRNSGRSSPAPGGPSTRGRQQTSGRTLGCTGFNNLGNTCYMNSALQCLRSVEELTKYFLTHEAKKEINTANLLGHNGEVALAYHRLLHEIYHTTKRPTTVAPRHFKGTIGRCAPTFSGYGQQDSQEFLGFLLDGLQEDLSRVLKKPYIEKPDSTDDMIGNKEKIREMAEKVWDITKKRDDSVIADLFTGLYQSTLQCPICHKISITFDPFNNLTLPLPVANGWSRNIRYYPLHDTPVEISVDIDKNSSIKTLKQFISTRVGVPVERLFGAEEFRDKFFKFYDDMSTASEEISGNDVAAFYELEDVPTNTGNVKATKQKVRSMLLDDDQEPMAWEDPMAERMLVPVIHRLNPEELAMRKNTRFRNNNNVDIPPPHFIMLTPAEARDENIIRKKILERIATYSTWPEFDDADDTDETTDPEMINTSSDVDFPGAPKVVAKSVEGEDDIVDVTMKDQGSEQETAPVDE